MPQAVLFLSHLLVTASKILYDAISSTIRQANRDLLQHAPGKGFIIIIECTSKVNSRDCCNATPT